MPQQIIQHIQNIKELFFVPGHIPRNKVQNNTHSPLIKVLQPIQEVHDHLLVDSDAALVLENFVQGDNGVGDDELVGVLDELVEFVDDIGFWRKS